jgi:hypothetical protein
VKKALIFLMMLVASAAFALPAAAQVYVRVGPPPPRYEAVPVARPGFAWQNGEWVWNGNRYVWRPGHWVRHPGHWVPAHWRRTPDGWVRVEGHWAP